MATEKPPLESNASTDQEIPPGPIVFVIGPPGSGKSTLCSRICQQIPGSFRHLSVGDYLRQLCNANASETQPGEVSAQADGRLPPEEVAKYVQKSKLLPPETIVPLIKEKLLDGQSSSSPGWLIDGFPRDIETALAFEKEVKAPSRVILLHCYVDFAKERFVRRRRNSTDDDELFDKRWNEYDEKLLAIHGHYRGIVTNVDTKGTKDESWGNLVQAVRSLPEFQGLRMFGLPGGT
ncbi:hypothetical protein INS49_003278 [Diaporthe citri]|uniref:uncharacterized protein n=1 Tax=Diaporthe citri TaxID=83186 RepID=UPI001C814DDC|nr:uncharacterized protein INS49_003278 [Diaporthe citri]KAG6355317.1 hypothetical protein INS49_003278 [Diaporthe citri]